jgi:phospholipid/cholesterol/gamma-HCH transport system substrate-binding protein
MRGPIAGFRWHVVTALAAVALSGTFLGLLVYKGGGLPSLTAQYHVRALVPSAVAVSPRSRVTIAGIDAGKVLSVKRQGDAAVVDLQIDGSHSPVPADTRVAVRERTLVGEKYVELTPGTSHRTLPSGAILPMRQADDFVEVDQILSKLRGKTRQRARDTIQALGQAVDGRGQQLNRLVEGTSGTISDGAPVVHTLARDHRQLTRLVANVGDITAQIGNRGRALRSLANEMDATFRAVAGRDAALRSILDQLPATLDQVRSTSGVLQSTTAHAAPVVARLATAVNDLGPTIKLLRPAAQEGHSVVDQLGTAAPPLQRTLTSLQRLSGPATQTLPQLGAALCQVNPLVRYVSPYGSELASMITGLGSAVNAYDANGHIARLYIGIGPNSLLGVQSPSVAKAESTLLSSGLLSQLHLLGYNPYPAPGHASDTTVGAHSIGPQGAATKYPRIQADC